MRDSANHFLRARLLAPAAMLALFLRMAGGCDSTNVGGGGAGHGGVPGQGGHGGLAGGGGASASGGSTGSGGSGTAGTAGGAGIGGRGGAATAGHGGGGATAGTTGSGGGGAGGSVSTGTGGSTGGRGGGSGGSAGSGGGLGGRGGTAGGGRGGSAGAGGAGGATSACGAVLALDRSCAAPADCFAGAHTINCCGSVQFIGLRNSEKAQYQALEAACDAGYPLCECPTQQPIADDGSRVKLAAEAAVTCWQGKCTTFVPDCGQPCAAGTTCFSCSNHASTFAACTTTCADSTACHDPALPLCQMGTSGNVSGKFCTAANVACDTK